MRQIAQILMALTSLVGFSGCGKYFYYPDKHFYYPPDKNGYSPDDVWFKSGDGNDLHGWFFRAAGKQPAKGTIVQFHGNSQNISSHYASLVWLTKHGYNLFTFDYRGFGDSPGKPNAEGLYKDGMAALDKAWQLHKKNKAAKFIVYGQSLGGNVALRSFADFSHRKETDLLVMDSTFVSFEDMVQEKMANIWITWPFSWLGPLFVSDKYASEPVIAEIKTPILIIHDKHDSVVEYQNGEKLYELATAKKDFWTFEKGRHTGVFYLDTPENRKRFLEYLARL